MSEEPGRWLRERLGETDFARLSSITFPASPNRLARLVDMVGAWREHLGKFEADLSAPADDRSVWGAHDYIAALAIRDRVARGLAILDPDIRAGIEPVVAELDQRFADFTEPDVEGCTERIDGRADPDRQWWWQRIPKAGPVREEISLYYRRPRSA